MRSCKVVEAAKSAWPTERRISESRGDLEAALPPAGEGTSVCRDAYPAIVGFVATEPDNESFVFRKFNNLAARRLLHMQSELLDLEQRLATLDVEAVSSTDHELQLSARGCERFMKNAKIREQEGKRKELADEIEVKLDKYHRALLLQREIAQLQRPSERVLSTCREALLGSDGKDPKLDGKARTLLDDETDLATLNPPTNNDALFTFLRQHWIFQTQRHPNDQHSNTRYFEERSLTWLIYLCGTAIAATSLIGSIVALHFVHNPDARLGIVLASIVFFALGLSVLTSASRNAIFAATAAYSAVLIVYISGNPGIGSTDPSSAFNGTLAP